MKSNSKSMSDDDNLGRCPTEDEKRSWTGPAKTTTVVNGLTFRSNFDSGNLMKVVLPAEQGGVGGIYQLWTARDCEGGPNTKRNSSWFHFGVSGGSTSQTITMRLMNLNNQSMLYRHGMTPVFRLSRNFIWTRLRQKVTHQEDGRHLQLQFRYFFTRDSEEVFFAFCFPYSYQDCERDLERCEDQARRDGMAVNALLLPRSGPTGCFHRELLTRTPQGRRVELITITDCHGILDEREPRIDSHLFPEFPSRRRPFEVEGKEIVFISARVHPGETPASFVFQGMLRFLLDASDPRAAELRRRFVFKMIPLLNPDGVAAGHFRQDCYGNNLNRHYAAPHPETHASVYAAKAVVMHHAARPIGRGQLTLYLDLHAHASSRGCFMYGNHLPGLEDQAENQLLPLLMTLNTPHFDYASCNFSLKHMSRVDSGDGGLSAEGTGRVFYGKHAGVLRSYTLECNYNTGKNLCNHVPPADTGKGGRFASPERKPTSAPLYHPHIWRDVGRGFLKALLDAEGASPWSRLPQSKFKTLQRARNFLVSELRSQSSYREQSLLLRRTGSSTAPPPLPRPPAHAPRRSGSSPSPALSGVASLCTRNPQPSRRAIEHTSVVRGDRGSGGAPTSPRMATLLAESGTPPPSLLLPKRPGRRSLPAAGAAAGAAGAALSYRKSCSTTQQHTGGVVRRNGGSSARGCSGSRGNRQEAVMPSSIEGAHSTGRSGGCHSGRTAHRARGARRHPPHAQHLKSSDGARLGGARHRSSARGTPRRGSDRGGGGGNARRRGSSRSKHRKGNATTRSGSAADGGIGSSRSNTRMRMARSSAASADVASESRASVLQPSPAAASVPPPPEVEDAGVFGARERECDKRSSMRQLAPGWK